MVGVLSLVNAVLVLPATVVDSDSCMVSVWLIMESLPVEVLSIGVSDTVI